MSLNDYKCCHAKCGKITYDKLTDKPFVKCQCGAWAEKMIAVPAPVRVGKYGKGGGLSESETS